MKKFLCTLFLYTGCSFVPESPVDLMTSTNNLLQNSLEDKSRQYPYWALNFDSFVVIDQDPNNPDATPEEKARARRIDILEKRLMLQKIDLVRFTLNTPEFASNLMKGVFRSSEDATGPKGTIKKGDIYDNKRILEILQRRTATFQIRKQLIGPGAAAVGALGVSIYVLDDKDPANYKPNWIAFPNREYWGGGGYLNYPYNSGTIFHELLHNAGFNHGVAENDTVTGLSEIYRNTVRDPVWRKKYRKQLNSFRYYETLHADLLLQDTVPVKTYNYVVAINNDDEEVTVCIIHLDGTYTIKKMKMSELS